MVSFKTSPINERDINTRLTLIFTKIGQLDKAQEGIQELYEFLLEHPEYDVKVNAFLASAGTFFQKYLRKALAEITTREMKACGMLSDKKPDPSPGPSPNPNPNSNSMNKKPSHKFPSTSNRCPHSSVSFNNHHHHHNNNNNNNNTKVFNNIDSHSDSSSTNDSSKTSSETSSETPTPITLSQMSKTFMDKIGRETFDQTRSRLHTIFQYEKYKTGQKRSSLPNIHQFQTDSDRLEFAKSILQSKPRYRRSSLMESSTLLPSNSPNRFNSLRRRS